MLGQRWAGGECHRHQTDPDDDCRCSSQGSAPCRGGIVVAVSWYSEDTTAARGTNIRRELNRQQVSDADAGSRVASVLVTSEEVLPFPECQPA
jgi:hypothetical protein